MSPEKKRSTKRHFLETESAFKRLMADARKDISSEATIDAIHDYEIRSGKLDRAKLSATIPGNAAFYLNFLLKAEQKSPGEVGKELGVDVQDLKHLQNEFTPITEKSLFDFCGRFVDKHSQFSVRPLFTLLKRAVVLHEMTSGEISIKKAARKKK